MRLIAPWLGDDVFFISVVAREVIYSQRGSSESPLSL